MVGNNANLFARMTGLLTGHAPIGRYYATHPTFKETLHATATDPHYNQGIMLDHCPLYSQYWESWLTVQHIKEHPLQELTESLQNNFQAFTSNTPPDI